MIILLPHESNKTLEGIKHFCRAIEKLLFLSANYTAMKKNLKEMAEWMGAYTLVSIAVALPFIGVFIFCFALFAAAIGLIFS